MKILFGFRCFSFLRIILFSVVIMQTSFALATEEIIKENLRKNLPHYEIESIELHEQSGLYVVALKNGPPLYAAKNGEHFLVGDLYRIDDKEGLINETEVAKLAQVEEQPADEMIIFAAENEKAHISVFTDITCGYCRMLHREIEELNDLGISVRYLAYPRAGTHSETYHQMVSIWCADDPNEWMTKAKEGQTVPGNECNNPVNSHYALGQSIGVRGTPTLVLSTGKLIPGYLPAQELAKELGL
ncbi:DsbC family protein [Marinomonas agarivorans]|nr:DsbC family protein [Marinomonas agarivorans]